MCCLGCRGVVCEDVGISRNSIFSPVDGSYVNDNGNLIYFTRKRIYWTAE